MNPAPQHPAALSDDALIAQCDVRRQRRSGPGGQHRNKVETAVVLEHRPSGVRAEASERRSQSRNRDVALRRLRLKLALAVRREWHAPSAVWNARCHTGRLAVNPEHADFPALLAEALDAFFAAEGDVSAASERLGCTASQFVKLLRKEPPALALINEQRRARGLRPLS
jgi:hypothetical protein